MRIRVGWQGALLAGVTVGLVCAAIVWARERAVIGHFMAPKAYCRLFGYDYVAMLAAIDQADKDAGDALILLRSPGAEAQPLRSEKINYFESKRQHLAVLADFVTKYFRGGYVHNVQCIGDRFLNRELGYPTFDRSEREEEAWKSLDKVFRGYSEMKRYSWVTTVISLLGTALGPLTTVLVFLWTGRRERKRADQRIVFPPR